MTPVPVLMVLYSSDAVEIRYSDGSCLELSPCGSSMIHHDAPDKREHPKYDQSKKVQKRTRFVTSEHRHKVLQALDFRNRFAERSYLCEDLLPKDDIVALYAKIDCITWPKLPEEAKIEIMPDGSRRITSLDEFATLVVSSHGHDFTVCYLSRLSEDKSKSKSSSAQTSISNSFGTSLKISQPSSVGKCPHETKYCLRPNETVVHPFKTADSSENVHLRYDQLKCNVDHSQFPEVVNKIDLQEMKCRNMLPETALNQVDNIMVQHDPTAEQRPETYGKNLEGIEINLHNSLNKGTGHLDNSAQTLNILNSERAFVETRNKSVVPSYPSNEIPKEQKHKPSIPFASDSLDSHDISNISRSSTPDGLRTTIDSNATLTQEFMSESFPEQAFVHKPRHSSPTHYTSSPYDVHGELHSKKAPRVLINEGVSLSGSFLGSQKVQGQCEQINCDHDVQQLKAPSHLVDDKSHTSIVEDKTKVNDSLKLENTMTHLPHDKSCGSNTVRCTSHTDPVSNVSNNAETVAKRSELKASSGHIQCPTEPDSIPGTLSFLTEKCSNIRLNKEYSVDKQCREKYLWTTKHCSRNECPIMWVHPLKLALEGTNLTNEDISSQPNLRRLQAVITSFKATEKKCIFTTVPPPLPITCPFQYNHTWEPNYDVDESSYSNSGEFQHGRLKIVISEGIVYRLVQRPNMKVVEVHPGDGSVLVSQGVKGHFFTHYMLVGDQLEERTYSLKSLPHRQMKGVYSIEKLIKTANRFLMMNTQWEQRGLKDDMPCWKKEVIAVVEPLPSSLLEECVVEGLGKFSAFTNGRVRIVFEDRTALDMVCNFSRRINECLQHSQEPLVSLPCASSVSPPMSNVESIFSASTGRLLLPSGQYVTMDINNPGPYKKYIQVAKEWAAWVGSSPIERQQFYTHHHMPTILQKAVEAELKKITCFSYILEQTMLMQQQLQSKNSDTGSTDKSSTQAADSHRSKTSLSRIQSSDQQWARALPHFSPLSALTPPLQDEAQFSYPSLWQKENSKDSLPFYQGPFSTSQHFNQNHASIRADQENSKQSARVEYVSNRKLDDTFQGFESVRQVLQQNSNLIKDIEQFLQGSEKS